MRRFLSLLLLAFSLPGQAVDLGNMRTWAAPDNTRVVFDLNGPITYRLFQIADPRRVVLDVHGARLSRPLAGSLASDRLVSRVRSAQRTTNDLRMVLDLQAAVDVKSFVLPPNRQYGYRLVIDLFSREPAEPPEFIPPPDSNDAKGRDVIVAIDAGHGGEDPGAVGPTGAYEKDVVLAIARKLGALLDEEPGMRAVLIRDGDYYIELRRRIKTARRYKADLFVSVHADAVRDPRASGSSVYVLSRHGASSEAARWLAEQENASDLIGGVALEEKDDQLKAVLLDLSQTGAIDASVDVGGRVLDRLDRLGKVHYPGVQRAGFAVLKSPDIPSILVETAYITNPLEERNLVDSHHQQDLAAAMLDGIRAYFGDRAPAGTLIAMRKGLLGRLEIAPEFSSTIR